MKKILITVGTRPNFIKVTQFKQVVETLQLDWDVRIVHTGQHYDDRMAKVFFDQFNLQPDHFLAIDLDDQMNSIDRELSRFIEEVFHPDIMIVPGDVNSTLAAARVAKKKGIKLAHLESGLRSFDNTMPEEFNRIETDKLSDMFFVTERSGLANIQSESLNGQVYLVGNTMIDTMVAFEENIQKSSITNELGLDNNDFVLMTIHRPSNVDSKEGLERLLSLLKYLDDKLKVVFPIHPRTTKRINEFGLQNAFDNLKSLIRTEPLSYFDFQKLVADCKFVLTDSGGIQEETTFRQIPCLTLRENTERPITVDVGTNTLVPFDVDIISEKIESILNGSYKKGAIPELWDGKATERIVNHLKSILFQEAF